jgi:putative component of toxin-antitoxin plasmid stabilization module
MTGKHTYDSFHVRLETNIDQEPQTILDRLSVMPNCDLENINKGSFKAIHDPLQGWRIVGVQNNQNFIVLCNEEKGIVEIIQ